MMGEEKGFEYLKALHANVNQYTKSGSAPIKAAAQGETMVGIVFQHDAVTMKVSRCARSAVVSPCEGTGYEIGSMSIVKGARNVESAKKFYDFALKADIQSLAAKAQAYQVPSNKAAHPAAGIAQVLGDQADRLRLRQVRLVGRARRGC